MRLSTLGPAAGVLLVSLSCGRDPSGPPSRLTVDRVEVARVADGVRLTNDSDEPLAYAVWASGFLGLFVPCTDPGSECVRLDPGATVVVPFEEITGIWPGEDTVIVRWWRVVPDGDGGYEALDLHELMIAL